MGKKLISEDIIKRIINVHGNKYDLSKLVYKNNRTKVEIICLEHGSWKTLTEQIFRGQGCPQCGLVLQGKKRRLTKEEFLTKCNEVHGNHYNYSKVDYQGMKKKVIIICSKHGDFEQTPSSHLNGSGCPQCGLNSQMDKRKLPKEDFISRSIKTHGYRYNYSKVEYINNHSEVEIECPIHGIFYQKPQFHMNGSCCPKCSLKEQHEKQKKSTDNFIIDSIKIHGDLYDYSMVEYVNSKSEVIIICKKHGEFLQSPNNHQRGNGCPNCNSSKGESFISQYLKENKIEYIEQHTFEGLKMKRNLKCDFFLPKHNVVIEFNGIQHYEPREQFGGEIGLMRTQKSDELKRKFCSNNGIRLLEIRYDDSDIINIIKTFLYSY